MKSTTVINKTEPKPEYPCLKHCNIQGREEYIILFTSHCEGTVVSNDSLSHLTIGTHLRSFDETKFSRLNGSVTLEN